MRHITHPKLRRSILFLLLLLLLLPISTSPTQAQNKSAVRSPQSAINGITPRNGKPFFLIGANYEGPTDAAWLMWDPSKFNPDLISQDFARARSIGINTVRLFVQRPLRDDINRGDFSKLDAVTSIARRNNLWLILSLTDWPEPDLQKAADLNLRIAAHLAGEPSILAYDVKNEPQFTDIAGAIYPSSTTVPLQTPDLIPAYGERVPHASIADYRRNQGSFIPTRMTDDQAYMMANYYEIYRSFLDSGASWVNVHPSSTTLDYMDSPDSASWQPFLAAVDSTLSTWVNIQIAPVRVADHARPITVGYSNIVFAKLLSNRALDFQSVHRFTSHGYSGLNATFLVLDNLQRTFSDQPILLEEFGYPGQVKSGDGVVGYDPRITANLESAVWAYLYANGFAGGAKWMLNNFPQGYDPAQNSFGLFDNSGQPKVTARALRQFASLASRPNASAGDFSSIHADDNSAVSFAYASSDALIAGGRVYTGTTVTYSATYPSSFVMGNDHGGVSLFATDNATATLNLPAIFGVPTQQLGNITLIGLDPQGQPWTRPTPQLTGDWLTVNLRALYSYRLTAIPTAVQPADSQPSADTVYFPQTKHNLSGDFLHYWQQNGALSTFGYPLSEPFTERGYTVQYFERNRFELHPENQPPYNVLLGRLGANAIAGRAFLPIEPFASTPDHRYFPETGHSLNYAFLGYWQRNGGLAQFGYPLSEELRERSTTDGKEYTVQYFERARFEYHPEYRGTTVEVLLGLLGVSSLQAKAWLP